VAAKAVSQEQFIWAARINQPKKYALPPSNDQGDRGSLPCPKCGGKEKHYMLGVSPCPDGGCKNCGAVTGHYFTCPDNPAFESRSRIEVGKEDVDCSSRIESAQKRIMEIGFRSTTVH
jgi:hypothetical protein